MNMYDSYFNVNKATWDLKAGYHAASAFYDLDAFKSGKSSLNSYELGALSDVAGKSLLHLQCHFGQDTLSWSRLGAQCVGVDFSNKAIEIAESLNKELALDARFFCGNVLDTAQLVNEKFDIVYTSYGDVGWLPDLKPWAAMIANCLKPGGIFYMVEFHPLVWMFDYTKQPAVLKYAYNETQMIYEEYKGTYAEPEAPMISKECTWNHGLGTVVNALIEAGLTVKFLREHDASPYNILPELIKTKSGFETKDKLYPLIYELKATTI
ncbi:class I SAM-dependent methyltransferase [Leeuwenhoekiella sp. MAR_2009_132]|uniref:class I SAM-dependent methyltransferase n=1 Tax=Leeuwenhoekiella sp. MAR_2009_132 TaxID=1392489 RepID=UPI00048B5B9D|nr:class I SAM-dependent methyltransferase [Leeuwenhoekiella sp. MAR_2009_132]